jgi:HPt (histidine-containing phosphotransfer) domain-containing protein
METQRHLAILDRTTALIRVGGDYELLSEMAQLFLNEFPKSLDELRAAVRARDPCRVERSAHSLKGSIGNFGAEAAFEAALRLEIAGRRGEMHSVDRLLTDLEEALRDLKPELMNLSGYMQ